MTKANPTLTMFALAGAILLICVMVAIFGDLSAFPLRHYK